MLRLNTTDLPLDRFPDYKDPLVSLECFPLDSETMASEDVVPAGPPNPANKLLGKVKDEQVSRHPSPQPTHLTVPLDKILVNGHNGTNGHNGINGHNGHKILRSATVGYIAPEFTGKDEQMKAGMSITVLRNTTFC
jgi:glutamate dehydrogenase